MDKDKINKKREELDLEKSRGKKYHMKKQYFLKKGYTEEQFEKFWNDDFVWEHKRLKKELEITEGIHWITFLIGLGYLCISIGGRIASPINEGIFDKYAYIGIVFMMTFVFQSWVIGYNRIKIEKNQENLIFN